MLKLSLILPLSRFVEREFSLKDFSAKLGLS